MKKLLLLALISLTAVAMAPQQSATTWRSLDEKVDEIIENAQTMQQAFAAVQRIFDQPEYAPYARLEEVKRRITSKIMERFVPRNPNPADTAARYLNTPAAQEWRKNYPQSESNK